MKHIKNFELFESKSNTIAGYIRDNGIKCNGKYPEFLFHGTDKNPKDFKLDPDLEWSEVDNGKVWDIEMPSGMLFLTTDIREAAGYGKYVIPFELNTKSILVKKVPTDGPSIAFDDDYNYGSEYKLWQDFQESTKDALEVRGVGKSTFVCPFELINPRMDIVKKFYSLKD